MVAGEVHQNAKPTFTIENNVLKGQEVPCNTRYTSVGELVLDKMRGQGNAIGQVDAVTDIEDNFADMLDRTIKCALWMKKQGVRRGDVIAICTHEHFDTFVPCVAALCLNAIFTPWDNNMNIISARHFVKLSEPKIVFANEQSVGAALEAAKIEVIETKVVVFGDYPGTIPFAEILKDHSKSDIANFRCTRVDNPQDTAAILYSSGTTGPPKGVQLSHFSLLNHLEVHEGLTLNGQTPLWFSSLYWITGTLLTLQSLVSGVQRIIAPKFEEEVACRIIEKYKVTWLLLSTSMANRFVKVGDYTKYDISSLTIIFTGGAILKREIQDQLKKALPHAAVLQAYGMTELGGLVSNQMPGTTSGSCGIVSRNCEIKFIDPETGKILGVNEHGEVCCKTRTMMTGYYRNPEATKSTIDDEGWLHTGDLGYFNEKGEIFIIDRLKELIKYRGYHVPPGDIENLLQSHPAVMEVAVVALPHDEDGDRPFAFVSTLPGTKVTAEELIDLVAKNLVDYCHLRGGVKFLDSLPHTATGKVARKELRLMLKTSRI